MTLPEDQNHWNNYTNPESLKFVDKAIARFQMQLMVSEFLAEVPESNRNIQGTIEKKLLILDFTTQIEAMSFSERNYRLILKAIELNPDLLKLAEKVRFQYAYGAAAFTFGLNVSRFK